MEKDNDAEENMHTLLRALSEQRRGATGELRKTARRVRPRVRLRPVSGRGGVSEVERGVGSLGGPWY